MKRPFALALLLGALAACGPVQSTAYLIDAQVQIEAARTAGAEKNAPYPWTLSNLYLRQARVETGYSNYDVALQYAEKASKFARQAKADAETVTQQESSQPAADTTEPTPLPSQGGNTP